MPHTIFVVDHDAATRGVVTDQLLADGYRAVATGEPGPARSALRQHPVDLLVLGDLEDRCVTFDLLRWVGSAGMGAGRRTPVLFLSRCDSDLDVVRAFEAGAEDVVRKPVSFAELRCRISALLRRATGVDRRRWLRAGDVTVDVALRGVTFGDQPVELTAREFDLLAALAREDRVFTKRELLADIWDFPADVPTRVVDAYACRLRMKLEQAGLPRHALLTHRGVGYRLAPGAARTSTPPHAST